jgi:hypothetical protein
MFEHSKLWYVTVVTIILWAVTILIRLGTYAYNGQSSAVGIASIMLFVVSLASLAGLVIGSVLAIREGVWYYWVIVVVFLGAIKLFVPGLMTTLQSQFIWWVLLACTTVTFGIPFVVYNTAKKREKRRANQVRRKEAIDTHEAFRTAEGYPKSI